MSHICFDVKIFLLLYCVLFCCIFSCFCCATLELGVHKVQFIKNDHFLIISPFVIDDARSMTTDRETQWRFDLRIEFKDRAQELKRVYKRVKVKIQRVSCSLTLVELELKLMAMHIFLVGCCWLTVKPSFINHQRTKCSSFQSFHVSHICRPIIQKQTFLFKYKSLL
jgi:hypothetical protein